MATRSRPARAPHRLAGDLVCAAVDLADEGGLGSLTMRRLGQQLRVGRCRSTTTSPARRHADGMVGLVFGENRPPARRHGLADGHHVHNGDRGRARSPRTLGDRADGSRRRPVRDAAAPDAVIGCLRTAGFSVAMARKCSAWTIRLRLRAAAGEPALHDVGGGGRVRTASCAFPPTRTPPGRADGRARPAAGLRLRGQVRPGHLILDGLERVRGSD